MEADLFNYASILEEAGRKEEANSMRQRALEVRERNAARVAPSDSERTGERTGGPKRQ